MNDKRPPTTSKSGIAKLRRAINQLENVERLLSGLPKFLYKKNKAELRSIIEEVETISEKTKAIAKNAKTPDR